MILLPSVELVDEHCLTVSRHRPVYVPCVVERVSLQTNVTMMILISSLYVLIVQWLHIVRLNVLVLMLKANVYLVG